jgi:VCBS repeat-containing protein
MRLSFLALTIALLGLPAYADNVTITGNVLFSSLDGSSLDHDHTVNGVFTVNDGDLTVLGSINCNDVDKGTSACSMQFAVSGNLELGAGSVISAENRVKDGSGGDISFTVGGNVLIDGLTGSTPGALISSSKTNSGTGFHAGNITINAGGIVNDGFGSIISAASVDGNAGAISITSSGQSTYYGLVLAGPSRELGSSPYTAEIMTGSGHVIGGNITLRALTSTEPGIRINFPAIIASQSGDVFGGGTVAIEGCNVQINSLVASLGRKNPGTRVVVRSGTTITVDASHLNGGGISHFGRVRADSIAEDASTNHVDLYAKDGVTVIGASSGSITSVTANQGDKGDAGTINVVATSGSVTASGNAIGATGSQKDEKGGSINVSAKFNVTMPGASLNASGGTSGSARAGGHINVRSYSGAVSWTAGTGDVRPVGSTSGVPSAQQGTISMTYCTTLTTTGTSFPTNGSPVGTFPTTAQTCSPAAPSLPAGNTLPTCNTPPVANNDNYTVAEGGTLNVPPPGVLSNDTDAEANPLTAILVTGPAHASSFTLNANGSFNYVHDGSETTSDSFTYKANDGSLDSNVATATITITPVNDAPVANNDSYSVAEGGTLNVTGPGVMSNDTDPDGPTMTAILVSGPSRAASFTFNADGSFNYVHDGSETTADSFTYKVSDGSLFSNVATVSITVSPVNDAPAAVNDSYTVAEGGTLSISAPGVLGNDTDPDSPTLTAVLVSGPAHASSFTLNANGSFNYVHDGGETTSDSFTYKVSDGSLFSNVATVSITVTPVNDAPVAVNDSYGVLEGGTVSPSAPGVLGNDTDSDSPALTAVLVSGPSHAASFTLNANGSFSYVHDGSETTSDSFTYKASDGSLFSNVATVSITVTPVDDAPVANNDSYSVAEAGTLNAAAPGVLGNDTDVDSPSLTAVLVSGPAHASSFTLNANGSFTYVHDGSETTTDSFTYKASDGSLFSNTATVSITISPVDDAPVASNDAYSVAEGGTLNVPAPGTLTNDTDVDSPSLTAILVSGPAHAASFTLNSDGSFLYVHDGSETTSDAFTYKANDGTLNSNVATVTITISPVNDAPVLTAGGTLNYTENAPASVIDNTITITDADSASLTGATAQISANYVSGQDVLSFAPIGAINAVFNPGTGTLTLSGSDTVANYQAAVRTVKYTNTSDNPSTAARTVTWQANDGVSLSNTATSTINVTAVNDAPVANSDSYTVAEGGTLNVAAPGVLSNDTDVDSPSLTAVLVSGPAHASSFTLNADGSFTYVHDGGETTSDGFTYKANDGALNSNVTTVSITITPVNDAPVAVNDSYGVAEGGTLSVIAPGVLGNDTDVDSPSLTAVLVTGPAHAASFTFNANGSFTYVHDGSETLTDSFTYKASDGSLQSNTATVSINITPVNDAPVANNDSYTAAEGGTLNVAAPGVLGNDTDPDGPSMTAVLVSGPSHAATFTLNADGSFTYVHDGSETTSDSFTYKVSDGSLFSNVATVSITVSPVNDAPVAVPDAYAVAEGGTLNVAAPGVLTNDTDVDSPSLTAVLVSSPTHASSFTLNADGSFTYVHDGSETLTDTFTYKANDGTSYSNVATVVITITPSNDAPTAVNDAYNVDEGATLNVAAPGVLGNDTDPDSPVLTAILVTGPVHASSFTLNADGSFTYVHDGSESTSDSFTYKANDGLSNSNVATATITVNPVNDAPVLTGGSAISYTENSVATAIDNTITITDVDSANLASATIQVTSNYASGQDVLSYTSAFGITGSFNAGTGILTLSGTSSVANYQTALRNVKYFNSSDDPSTATRTVTFRVNDGGAVNNLSNIVSSTVSITAVNDPPVALAYSGLPAQAGIPITYPAGKLGGTDAEAGTTVTIDTTPLNLINIAALTLNANGSFTMTPTPGSAGGTASFQYRVSDNGNPPPGANSAYVTVSFAVAGPAIYFVKNPAVGVANCTLGNECSIATAISNIGASPNASIFLEDANTHTAASAITLNSGGSIIGQGVSAASFDSFYGIGTPAQGTLAARPAVNQARPTVASDVTLNTNSQARGFNLNTTGGDSLAASSRTGLVVSDMNVTNLGGSLVAGVRFTNSSGTFTFGTITASANAGGINFNGTTSTSTVTFGNITTSTGAAVTVASSGATNFTFGDVTSTIGIAMSVNSATGAFVVHAINAKGATKGISVTSATGSFAVTGTGTTAGSGGTVQNCSQRGSEFFGSSSINLANMIFTGNGTGGAGSVSSVCGDALNQSTTAIGSLPTNCQANVYLQSSTSVTLNNVTANGSKEHGIWGNDVTGLTLINVDARQNGDEVGEDGVQLVNQKGTVTVTGGTFKDNASRSFEIQNNSGTPTVTITSAAFGNTLNPTAVTTPSTATAADTILLATNGTNSASITSVIKGSTFNNIFGRALNANTEGSTSQNITFGQSGAGNGNSVQNVSFGTDFNGTTSGTVTYSIENNAFTNVAGSVTSGARTVINARKGFGATGSWSGTINANTIGTVGVPKSGCDAVSCGGISADSAAASGNYDLKITNNSIARVNGHGIDVENLAAGTMRATITGNFLQDPEDGTTGAGGNQGSGVLVATSSAGASINAKAGGSITSDKNTVTGNWNTNGGGTVRGIRFSRGNGTTFCVSGFSGPFDSSSVATYITSQNIGNVGSATQPVGQTGYSGPSCPTP